MSLVKNFKVGDVSYTIRDVNTNRSLDETQKARLLLDGTYEGSTIDDGEVFAEYDGKFVEFDKTLNNGGVWKKDSATGLPSWRTCVVKASDGKFYATYHTTNSSSLYVSEDGLNWTVKNLSASVKVSNLVATNGFLYGYNTGGGAAPVRINIETGAVEELVGGVGIVYSISYGNGSYVVTGSNGVYASTDGINFTQTLSTSYSNIIFDGSRFISVYSNGNIHTSSDGFTWEVVGSFSNWVFGLEYVLGYYVIISDTSAYRSTNLTDWSSSSHGQRYTGTISLRKAGNTLLIDSADVTKLISTDGGASWSTITLDASANKSYPTCVVEGSFWVLGYGERHVYLSEPFYEYSLAPLSYTKAEVDAAIAGVDLTGYLKNDATAGLTIMGTAATSADAMNIGASSRAYSASVSLGYGALSGVNGYTSGSTAVGYFSKANAFDATAIGARAEVSAQNAIQIGRGTNSTTSTMNVGLALDKNYTLLNADGTIPAERLVNAPQPDMSEYQKKLAAGKGLEITEGGERYSVVGSVAVDSNKVASGFSARASYLSAPNVIFDESTVSGHSGFEMVIAFEVSSVSSSGSLFTVSPSGSATALAIGLRIYQGKLSAFCGSSSSTIQGTTSLTANTKVYAKLKYDDGAGYTLQYSTNGTEWSNEATLASTSIAASLNSEMCIGYTASSSGGLKVYLPETYVTVDNKEVWRASTVETVNSNSSWTAAQSMPSAKFTNLTLGASGSTFTAPATGWVHLDKRTSVENQYITVTNTSIAITSTAISPAVGTCRILVPIQKGHTFAVHYTADGDVTTFKFYYAEGEK